MTNEMELNDAAIEAGLNPRDVLRWYRDPEVQRKPGYAEMPADKLIKTYQQGVMLVDQAKTGKIDLNALTQSARLPTTVNPYAGTTQAAANPAAPNASSINQFDPAAMKAAQEKFNTEREGGQTARTISDVLAGLALGSSGGASTKYNEELQKKYYDQLYDQTIGQQKRLQEQATAGQAATTSAQAREEAAGKYTGTQQKLQQEIDTGALGLQVQKDMNDPKSTQTMLAKSMLEDQFKAAGIGISPELRNKMNSSGVTAQQLLGFMDPKVLEAFKTKAGINKTIAETAVTQAEARNLETQNEGYRQQQGMPKANYALPEGTIRFPNAGNAQPSAIPALPAGSTSAPTQEGTEPTFNFKPGTDLNTMRRYLAASKDFPPEHLAAFDKQFPNIPPTPAGAGRGNVNPPLIGESQTKPSFDKLQGSMVKPDNFEPEYIANAKTSDLSPIQKLERQRLESTDNAEVIRLEKEIANARGVPYIKAGSGPQMITTPAGKGFSTSVSPVSTDAMQRTGKSIQAKADSVDTFNSTGRPAAQNAIRLAGSAGIDKFGNHLPLSNEDSDRLQKYVDRMNAEAQRLGVVVGAPPSAAAGAVAGALGSIHPLLGASAGAFAALANQKQPISNLTPPEVIKQFGYATQLVAERQKALIAKENAWSARNSGDTSGFVQSPDYKYIMNAEPYVNPHTGDLMLPLSRSQQDQMLKQGYGPLSAVSFSSFKQQGK